MAGIFNRIKNWVKNETVKAADLNAEINNVINNIDPTKMSGYSTNVAQMQIQTTPGSLGSESLSQTTSDEVERLRFVLARLLGQTYWYTAPTLSLADMNSLIAQGNLTPPANRIVSGKMRATSNQAAFLVANGAAATVALKGASTNFVYRVNNTAYTISTDITKTGLSLAPATATAQVNDTSLAAGIATKIQGEGSTNIVIDTQTGNFTSGAIVNTFQAFKITHGGNTEYFLGYMKDANTISKCFRGFFFDSSSAPIVRIAIADNDPITLMKMAWLYANINGTLSVSYTNPTYAFTTPTSPATGDYWFDLTAKLWKVYNGSSFAIANETLVGLSIQDTANCVAARSFEFYAPYDSKNTLTIETQDTNTLRNTQLGQRINVGGNLISFDENLVRWAMPGNLDTALSETSSTTYYAYLKDTGDVVLSDVVPYDRTADLGGKYHPHNPWRSVGQVFNDASNNFGAVTSDSNVLTKTPFNQGSNPNCINLGLRYSAGTLTICAADQSDLSSDNSAYIFLPSATNGKTVRLRMIANVTIKDQTTGSSDFAGMLLGTTTTVAWGSKKPFYLFAANLNDTDAGLAFYITGVPNRTSVRGTTLIGYKGTAASSSNLNNQIFLLSSTPAAYASLPSVMIGGFAMTKNTSDDWTIFLAYDTTLNFQNIDARPMENTVWTMPVGQLGATAAHFLGAASGSIPTWTSESFTYQVNTNGLISLTCQLAGVATNGSSAIGVFLASPFAFANTLPILCGNYQATAHAIAKGPLLGLQNTSPSKVNLYDGSFTTALINTDFSNANDQINFSVVTYAA